ncbi:hypothetical protein EGT07_30380, partial [Herbaspirillum sp. HC18]
VVKARPLSAADAGGLDTEPEAVREKLALRAKRPLPPAAPKEQPKAEPAPTPPSAAPAASAPTGWSDSEVAAALKTCVQLLGPAAAEVEALPAMKQDRCGTAAPVLLRRVGAGASSVEVQPPAVLNCAMVAKLAQWVEKTLQPVAKDTL